MGYTIDIAVNTIKVNNLMEIETIILDTAKLYECEHIYTTCEQDGTLKIPRHHYVFTVIFLDENVENLVKFILSAYIVMIIVKIR